MDSDRRSAQVERLQVVDTGRRRRWSEEEKLKIVVESFQGLGEDEDWLRDVANEMEIEDGAIWVYGVGEHGIQAFTDFGIENLIELVRMYKESPELLKRWPPE
jgi:transposase-like protein